MVIWGVQSSGISSCCLSDVALALVIVISVEVYLPLSSRRDLWRSELMGKLALKLIVRSLLVGLGSGSDFLNDGFGKLHV